MHAFDLEMTRQGYGLVRYADDFVIFAKSESEATAALTAARRVLEGPLKLRLHPEKTRVVSVDERSFGIGPATWARRVSVVITVALLTDEHLSSPGDRISASVF